MDPKFALLITDNITTTLTTVTTTLTTEFSKSTYSSNLAITLALASIFIGLALWCLAWNAKEETKNLGKFAFVLTFIFFILTTVWTFSIQNNSLNIIALVIILILAFVLFATKNKLVKTEAPIQNENLFKELLVMSIDKTNFSRQNKNNDLAQNAKKFAEAYNIIKITIKDGTNTKTYSAKEVTMETSNNKTPNQKSVD